MTADSIVSIVLLHFNHLCSYVLLNDSRKATGYLQDYVHPPLLPLEFSALFRLFFSPPLVCGEAESHLKRIIMAYCKFGEGHLP